MMPSVKTLFRKLHIPKLEHPCLIHFKQSIRNDMTTTNFDQQMQGNDTAMYLIHKKLIENEEQVAASGIPTPGR